MLLLAILNYIRIQGVKSNDCIHDFLSRTAWSKHENEHLRRGCDERRDKHRLKKQGQTNTSFCHTVHFRVIVSNDNMAAAVLPALDPLFQRNAKRTREIFASVPEDGMKDEERRQVNANNDIEPILLTLSWHSTRLRLSVKINDDYRDYKELPSALMSQQGPVGPSRPKENRKLITAGRE